MQSGALLRLIDRKAPVEFGLYWLVGTPLGNIKILHSGQSAPSLRRKVFGADTTGPEVADWYSSIIELSKFFFLPKGLLVTRGQRNTAGVGHKRKA